MYNRYIPDGASYARIAEEDAPPYVPPLSHPGPQPAAHTPETEPLRQDAHEEQPHTETAAPTQEGAEETTKPGGLSALLKGLKLEDLDTGDILLLLIMLFLFLEGDDIELIITLGLMLLLGLD